MTASGVDRTLCRCSDLNAMASMRLISMYKIKAVAAPDCGLKFCALLEKLCNAGPTVLLNFVQCLILLLHQSPCFNHVRISSSTEPSNPSGSARCLRFQHHRPSFADHSTPSGSHDGHAPTSRRSFVLRCCDLPPTYVHTRIPSHQDPVSRVESWPLCCLVYLQYTG